MTSVGLGHSGMHGLPVPLGPPDLRPDSHRHPQGPNNGGHDRIRSFVVIRSTRNVQAQAAIDDA